MSGMEAIQSDPIRSEHHEALHRMALLPNYYDWVFERIQPWVGSRILDAGGGIGNIAELLPKWERLVLIDANQAQCDEMRDRFKGVDAVEVWTQDILDPNIVRLGPEAFDTIMVLDVLEHIKSDEQALHHFKELLAPGGHLLLKIPAHPCLY